MAAKKTAAPVPANKNTANAADLLGQLGALLPPAKPKATGKQKWEVVLSGDDAVKFNRWIEAKMVSEVTTSRLENSKDDFTELAMDVIAKSMWKSKTRPSNPVFIVRTDDKNDSQCVFLFTDKFKIRFPEMPEDVVPRNFLIGIFVGLGLEEGDAARLVDNELDLNPVVGIRSLTELLQGRYGEKRQWVEASDEEKAVGQKLMAYLTAVPDETGEATVPALTPQERALVIERDSGIKVKADFYARVCSYCHSVEQLKAIFKVLIPVAYPAHQKFGMNDTPESRTNRLVSAAADIIGVGVTEESDED